MNDMIFKALSEIAGAENVVANEPMCKHTTFRIGGYADIYVKPSTTEQFTKILKFLKESSVPYFIMGNGSNILVSDDGIRGVVIEVSSNFADAFVTGDKIEAKSGIKLVSLSNKALGEELAGMEFASGIPGTLGGAVYMNAGAYGGEMKDIVESVTYYDVEKDEVITLLGSECRFGYRTSVFVENGGVILSAVINLKKGKKEEIKSKMTELARKRNEKQPVDKPSAGSTFKRPEGYFAGTLIEQSGLKGFSVGGAQVSEKHAGFVINSGGATANDVRQLVKKVSDIVFEKHGVRLEPEVKFIGDF